MNEDKTKLVITVETSDGPKEFDVLIAKNADHVHLRIKLEQTQNSIEIVPEGTKQIEKYERICSNIYTWFDKLERLSKSKLSVLIEDEVSRIREGINELDPDTPTAKIFLRYLDTVIGQIEENWQNHLACISRLNLKKFSKSGKCS